MNEFLRHCMFYAKGYYDRRDLVEDIKIIASHFSNYPGDISNTFLIRLLCQHVLPAILNKPYPIDDLERIFLTIYRYSKDNFGDVLFVISPIIFELANIDVTQKDEEGNLVYDLGEPDYNILPRPRGIK